MSKISFSMKMSDRMISRLHSIYNNDIDSYLADDEYFELALCLAYMTLSKEKIIKKDMKNTDRLDRITEKVSVEDIEKLFSEDFCEELPDILAAREDNRTWILDNIRDSIMHDCFEIDEECQCFLIDNKYYDRELEVIVPFKWFIAYMKNDILSKRISNRVTVNGFFYNQYATQREEYSSRRGLIDNILYKVEVYGEDLNIEQIQERVRTLLLEYSKEEITEEDKRKYSKYCKKDDKKDDLYLISFFRARNKLRKQLMQEYPNIQNMKIYINEAKHRLDNKVVKKLPNTYNSYDFLFQGLNQLLEPKSISLLKNITSIYDGVEKRKEGYSSKDWIEDMIHLVRGESYQVREDHHHYNKEYENARTELLLTFLHIYGLTTLVINSETLYDESILEGLRDEVRGYSKKAYEEYKIERKRLTKAILKTKIELERLQDQYRKCPDNVKNKLKKKIEEKEQMIHTLVGDLESLEKDTYKVIVDRELYEKNYDHIEELRYDFKRYNDLFEKAETITQKESLKKIIETVEDSILSLEETYTFASCKNAELLTIIRNCFSHIGRITLTKEGIGELKVICNDYDNNGVHSGYLRCDYKTLLEILRTPFISENEKPKEFVKK